MPDIVVHNTFGKDIYNAMPEQIHQHVSFRLFEMSLNGPDDWALYRFWVPPFRNGINKRSRIMHYTKCGEFLFELAIQAKNSLYRDYMFSYLCGFLCHYALDSSTHPYINARAGIYDGTLNTVQYAGNHMALEHTLDIMELERQNIKLHGRPISRNFFFTKSLPKEIKSDIDQVYDTVYGWKNVWVDLNKSRLDMYRVYYLMEDPHGILYRLCKKVKVIKPSFYALSYYQKLFLDDPANIQHRTWLNPYKEGESSCESFYDLLDRAKDKAFKMVEIAFLYIYKDGNLQDLKDVIGYSSYVTGLKAD